MENIMYILCTALLVRTAIYLTKTYFGETKSKASTTPSKENSSFSAANDWIEEWILKHDFNYDTATDKEIKKYRLNLMLLSVMVEMQCFFDSKDESFNANIAFPIRIADEYFPVMNQMIKEFNEVNSDHHLMLNKNEGVLHLRTAMSKESIRLIDASDPAAVFPKMFQIADKVFQEFMHVMYGSTLPQLAIFKVAGMRTVLLN